jgi:hypothetical protein
MILINQSSTGSLIESWGNLQGEALRPHHVPASSVAAKYRQGKHLSLYLEKECKN